MSEVIQETLVSDDVEQVAALKSKVSEKVDGAYSKYLVMTELKRQYDAAKKEYDVDKLLLDEIVDVHIPAGEQTALDGSNCGVSVGKRANKAEIDQKELQEVLGLDSYLELSKVGVTDVRKYCVADELKRVLTEERTGARKFTWYEK